MMYFNVPKQLSLATFGGDHISALLTPPVTDVIMPRREMGRLLTDKVIDLLFILFVKLHRHMAGAK